MHKLESLIQRNFAIICCTY